MPKRYNPHFEENSPITKRVEMRPCIDGGWVSIEDYKHMYFEWVDFAHLAYKVKLLICAENEAITNAELIEILAERLNG